MPQLAKGKGNKMINIAPVKVAMREEFVKEVAILNENQNLLILGEGKPFTLKPKDWHYYTGERANRGNKLPRGCRHVMGLKVG